MAWFREEILEGSLSNLWITAPNRRYSWQVNKLLKLSSLIFGFIKLRVENGVTARFWTDNWSPYGTLRSYLVSKGGSFLGISLQATVASLFRDDNWMLPLRDTVLVKFMGSSVRLESRCLGIILYGTGVGFPDITSSLGFLS